jgi:5'-nucleotidase
MKPLALLTNDDGIDSAFLHALAAALQADFRVAVAAPATEQSWIGRALTRKGEIGVAHRPDDFPGTDLAWAIGGTPSDCVNIALGNLLSERPAIVCSGINIGYNTTETLILSSGTVAGAIEGALWGIPAIAFSKCIAHEHFMRISQRQGQCEGEVAESLAAAASHAAAIARATLAAPETPGRVININFPASTTTATAIREAVPAKIELGSLFEEIRPGCYQFRYTEGTLRECSGESDRAVLAAGHISRSVLDFSRIGRMD